MYPFWRTEGLDGIIPSTARRLDHQTAEIVGVCILLTHQTFTRLHVQLTPDAESDRLSTLIFRVGEADCATGAMIVAGPGSKAADIMRSTCATDDLIPAVRFVYSIGGGFD
ncbi:MAG TPA: hypothetical protein P5081_10020 [Phycisphaerae bacterium]|nr:hypothetical protein [Phycisphaerae bacterium]HRW53214.1 hypothetical protein [Phycisphaerae bacterium]